MEQKFPFGGLFGSHSDGSQTACGEVVSCEKAGVGKTHAAIVKLMKRRFEGMLFVPIHKWRQIYRYPCQHLFSSAPIIIYREFGSKKKRKKYRTCLEPWTDRSTLRLAYRKITIVLLFQRLQVPCVNLTCWCISVTTWTQPTGWANLMNLKSITSSSTH